MNKREWEISEQYRAEDAMARRWPNPERCALFIGRYQPLHDGHKALIQVALDEGKRVVVALMDTMPDAANPYTVEQRRAMFAEAFGEAVEVISIPPVEEVCYGRNVGYRIRRIHLSPELEAINATSIREASRE